MDVDAGTCDMRLWFQGAVSGAMCQSLNAGMRETDHLQKEESKQLHGISLRVASRSQVSQRFWSNSTTKFDSFGD